MDLVDNLLIQNQETMRIISIIQSGYIAFNPLEIEKLITEDDKFLKGMRVKLIMRYMKDAGITAGTKMVSVKYRFKGTITPQKNQFKLIVLKSAGNRIIPDKPRPRIKRIIKLKK